VSDLKVMKRRMGRSAVLRDEGYEEYGTSVFGVDE
jgi:hypothetical protein